MKQPIEGNGPENLSMRQRDTFYESRPSASDILGQALILSAIAEDEDHEYNVDFLNEKADDLFPLPIHVYVDGHVYHTLPDSLKKAEIDPTKPLSGYFNCFEYADIPFSEFTGGQLSDEDSNFCLKIYMGEKSFDNDFTEGNFSHYVYIPVRNISNISAISEFDNNFKNPERRVDDVEDIYLNLLLDIDSVRDRLRKDKTTDVQELETWDYRAIPGKPSLYEYRYLPLCGLAQYGYLQQDYENDYRAICHVRDIYFIGFYLGLLSHQALGMERKPHFAFEVYSNDFNSNVGSFSERAAPILLVPVSDEVGLEIELVPDAEEQM